jgi:predicted permease
LVAVLSLAIGIGGNTAIFSLINAVMLRKLPVADPDGLVSVSTLRPDSRANEFSYPMLEEFERQQQAFSSMFGLWEWVPNVEIRGVLSRDSVIAVTGKFYSTLGITPLKGRFITSEDESGEHGPAPVAVISYGCWQRRYGGDQNVVGQTIKIDGVPYTVIGITRKDFFGLEVGMAPEATVPFAAQAGLRLRNRSRFLLNVVGRLKPGVNAQQAQAQLEALWSGIKMATVPDDWNAEQKERFFARRIKITSAATGFSFLRERFARPLFVLMAVVGVVLLIACLNLANLLLTRSSARKAELSIRAALGASRRRLVQQLLTESMLLSLAAAVAGLFIAYWASHILADFMWTGNAPLALDLAPDLQIVTFTIGLTILTTLLFGVAPALHGIVRSPANSIQQNLPTTVSGGGRFGLGKLLISIQVALSVVLLTGAGLFGKSLGQLRSVNPGFQAEGVLVTWLVPRTDGYKDLDRPNYYQQLLESLSHLPGVSSVSMSHVSPIFAFGSKVPVSSNPLDPAVAKVEADQHLISPRFFETLRIPLIRGRDFTFRDDDHATRVAIISKGLSQHLFQSSDAVGRRIAVGTAMEDQNVEVIGVAGDANLWDVRKQKPLAVYLAYFQQPKRMSSPSVELRATIDAAALAPAVHQRVEKLGREFPFKTQTLVEQINRSLVQEILLTTLSELLACSTLLFACVGLYGLMSFIVLQRTPEIGLRIALGATRNNVLTLILQQTLAIILIGLVVGVIISYFASHLIANMLFGISSKDPSTFITASIVLLLISLMASFIPSLKASRIAPIAALRNQ